MFIQLLRSYISHEKLYLYSCYSGIGSYIIGCINFTYFIAVIAGFEFKDILRCLISLCNNFIVYSQYVYQHRRYGEIE